MKFRQLVITAMTAGLSVSGSIASANVQLQPAADPGRCLASNLPVSGLPGREYEYYQNLWIDGSELRSRVNLRLRPGFENKPDTYGLVGDFVMATNYYFDQSCTLWVRIYFPESSYIGWIHGDYATAAYRQEYVPIPDGQGY